MTTTTIILGVVVGLALLFILFTLYCYIFYAGNIDRIFQTKPLLLGDVGQPMPGGQDVTLTIPGTERQLQATLLPATNPQRRGTVLFLHEFGATRWMAIPYAHHLRDLGFDLFTFDFNSSGSSDAIDGYEPLQWPTEFERDDAQAALDYLTSRPEGSGENVVAFGISKGGGTAVALAAENPAVKAVITDGAFPVHGMVLHYSMKFIEIYSDSRFIYRILPRWFYRILVSWSLRRVEQTRGVRYLRLEQALGKLAPRPLLMIRGEKDNYVNEAVTKRFLSFAREPKELWVVPRAKHNRCLDKDEKAYRERVQEFVLRCFPHPTTASTEASGKRAS